MIFRRDQGQILLYYCDREKMKEMNLDKSLQQNRGFFFFAHPHLMSPRFHELYFLVCYPQGCILSWIFSFYKLMNVINRKCVIFFSEILPI